MPATPQSGRFFGEQVRIREVDGFILSESVYVAGQSISPHSHSSPYLSILLQGSYHETCEEQTRIYEPSSVVFHPAGETHADRFLGNGGRIFRFEITNSRRMAASSGAAVLASPFVFVGGPIAWLATRLYSEFRQTDRYSPLVMEGLVLEILGLAGRDASLPRSDQPPLWLRRVEQLLRESTPDDLSLPGIAEVAGVHVVHLARVFRRFHGCTVGEYLRGLRIDRAVRELCATRKPLAEVAGSAGFADQSHFCRAFKLSTGMTPGQYRKSFRRR
jgi:AraC family transcriptional regulator